MSVVCEVFNGCDFFQVIFEELGMEVDLVSGFEEVWLIYLGVFLGMLFGDCLYFLFDIGGGFMELIFVDGCDVCVLISICVGVV